MSVKAWLQKNQVYDKDLVTLFPKFGVKDPEKDLKDLTPGNWKKIQAQLKKDRSKELKDGAAKLRLQKKLTKIEKLWRAKRPKKKTKAPKLLSLFADDKPPTEVNGSHTKKKNKNKKKGAQSPKKRDQTQKNQSKAQQNDTKKDKNSKEAKPTDETKNDNYKDTKDNKDNKSNKDNKDNKDNKGSKDDKDNVDSKDNKGNKDNKDNKDSTDNKDKQQDNKNDDDEWKYDDVLNISDNEDEQQDNNAITIPILPTQGSVVDMLLNIENNNENNNEQKEDKKEEESVEINITNIDNNNNTENNENKEEDEWHYDDVLKISDDEDDQQIQTQNDTNELIIPMFKLKTQGSVVDMLMAGPYNTNKVKNKPPVNKKISVTPPEPTTDTIEKDYSITVSFGGDTKDANDNKNHTQTNETNQKSEQTDDKQEENKEKTEDKKEENNSKSSKLKVSLNADNFQYNESTKAYSISLSGCKLMKSDFMNGTITFEINKEFINVNESDHVDDKYIDKVLDEIHRNNPDTETED